MTNVTFAAIGTFEWVLIVMVAGMFLMIPLSLLVALWAWTRSRHAPPVQAPDDRHTTLIDF